MSINLARGVDLQAVDSQPTYRAPLQKNRGTKTTIYVTIAVFSLAAFAALIIAGVLTHNRTLLYASIVPATLGVGFFGAGCSHAASKSKRVYSQSAL